MLQQQLWPLARISINLACVALGWRLKQKNCRKINFEIFLSENRNSKIKKIGFDIDQS